MTIRTWFYQQFDADHAREVPAEGYGGWRSAELELDPARTAVVCMHAWDVGPLAEAPGMWRSVEYVPRSYAIAERVFPPLFAAVRRSPLRLLHVVGGGDYFRELPGYRRAVALAGPEPPPPERVPADPIWQRLQQFRSDHVWRGRHNHQDLAARGRRIDFLPAARPTGDEGVAETTAQLLALCLDQGLDHLIYGGFAVDACLLSSPGGMLEMSRHGLLCSVLRDATCAVENKETARGELAKALGLWRVALSFGFVYDSTDLVAALTHLENPR